PNSDQALCIYQGLEQWKGGPIAATPESLRSEAATGTPSSGRAGHLRVRDGYDEDRSPLYYLIAGAPFLVRPDSWLPEAFVPFLAVTPYLFFGVMLGASLWYVARRLYGNTGGYIALALYCFSPAMIVNVAGAQSLGEMGAVWGAFGTVFTAIAVAHTLYAPREVVLWNWRRILLMGLSIAICVGAQFSLWILLVPALAFMLWVGHVRPGAAMAIFAAACAFGLLLLWAVYSFRPAAFATALYSATWLRPPADDPSWHSATSLFATFFLQNGLGLVLLLAVCVVTFAAWKRARFFGTAAPLIVGAILVGMATRMHFAGPMFLLAGLPFLILFMAGVSTDLRAGSQYRNRRSTDRQCND